MNADSWAPEPKLGRNEKVEFSLQWPVGRRLEALDSKYNKKFMYVKSNL